MMTKRVFEKAALVVRAWREAEIGEGPVRVAGRDLWVSNAIEEAFVQLFQEDNPRFDRARFHGETLFRSEDKRARR
jgi:hypothetical protein